VINTQKADQGGRCKVQASQRGGRTSALTKVRQFERVRESMPPQQRRNRFRSQTSLKLRRRGDTGEEVKRVRRQRRKGKKVIQDVKNRSSKKLLERYTAIAEKGKGKKKKDSLSGSRWGYIRIKGVGRASTTRGEEGNHMQNGAKANVQKGSADWRGQGLGKLKLLGGGIKRLKVTR